MKEVKNIGKISLARNAEHFQYHSDALGIITEEFATAQKITALRTTYKSLFDKEDSAFVLSQKLAGTAEIEAKDKVRDDLTRYVFSIIDAKTLSPVTTEKEAAQRLSAKLSPYRGANAKPYAENTALVTNMVGDMLSSDFSADTAAVGLTEIANQLKTANDDFNTTYLARSSEKLSRDQTSSLKDIRPKVDDAFRAIAEVITALYCVNHYITKDSTVEATLSAVIDKLNAIILQLNETISRRTGGGSSSSSSTDDDSSSSTGDNSSSTGDNSGSSSTGDNSGSSSTGDNSGSSDSGGNSGNSGGSSSGDSGSDDGDTI